MQGVSFLPNVLNIVISSLVVIAAVLLLLALKKGKFASFDEPFIRLALSLYGIRSIGHSAIYLHMMMGHGGTRFPQGVTVDLALLLLTDVFTIFSLFAWATVLRAPRKKFVWTTFEQILSGCILVVVADTWLFFHRSSWVLFPSAVLNALSVGAAVGAAAFRYRRHSIPLVV